jgi:hypothetical protein
MLSRSTDSHASRSTAPIPFSSKNHVVVRSELLTGLGPSIKVVLRSNSTTDTLNGPHRPELLEGRRAVDRRLVDAGSLIDIISSAIRLNRALLRRSGRRVVRAIRLNDVVLDKGIARPAIERNVAVDASGIPGPRVVDDLSTAGIPALAGYEVAHVGPLDAVFAARLVVVVDGTFAVGPEGVEETVVGAGALGCGASDKLEGRGDYCGRTAEGQEDGGESDHDDVVIGSSLVVYR